MKNLYESGEDYLETILILTEKTDVVRNIDIASYLGYTKPSVSRALGILKENGYIKIAQNGHISLTDKGQKKAGEVYERHELLTRFLVESLGVSFKTAQQDACRIEHILSEETFLKIKDSLKKQEE